MNNKVVFLKYTTINGGLTGAYFLLYYLLIEFLSVNYVVSNMISYIITALAAYYMTKVFVFMSAQDGKMEFLLFIVVRIALAGISSMGLGLFVKMLAMEEYIAFVMANLVCFPSSYIINSWIFMGKKTA